MPCHFDNQNLDDYYEDVGSETGIEAEPEYRELSREEKMEQALCEIWQMMDSTVSDSISAHLESILTKLEIPHDALILGEPKEPESPVVGQIRDFLKFSAKALHG